MRNAILANELAKVLLPTGHAVAVEDPNHSSGESFRRILGKVEGCLQQHNKTNFTDVCAFNELIGNPFGAATNEQLYKQFDLITSEMEELLNGLSMLKDAAKQMATAKDEDELLMAQQDRDKAVMEIRDGIADVLVTTYGLAHRMGIDADKDMLAVSSSNASKFFTGTEPEAAEACKALADSLGIQVEARMACETGTATPEYAVCVWAFVSADDSDPERPRGKLLKAPGYKPPVFD